MASLIAILDLKGKPLIQRTYRDDVPAASLEQFIPLIYEMEEENQQIVPCFTSKNGVNYMHIKHSNLYLLAVSQRNTNAMEVLIFLNKLKEVLIEYFKALEEESIRDNFVIIYELMDEMMDYGHPQTTDNKTLQEYITQEYHALEIQQQGKSAALVTNAVSWRAEGLKYKRNEVFLDVIESVNMVVNTSGSVVRSEILGKVQMKCYLSGMPELRLGLNDKVASDSSGRSGQNSIEMEDMRFHQCVRLARFESDRTISFIPPDGEFELMSYRISTHIEKPLIWVEASVNHFGTRIQFTVKVNAQFKRSSSANNVEILVPVPEDADTPKFKVPAGSATYAPDKGAFIWKLKKLPGGKDYTMRAELSLPTIRSTDVDSLAAEKGQRAPITVKFEIPYFTVSGIKVRYLKTIEKSGYQAVPWVRYITQNGDYSLRTGPLPSASARGDGYEGS